MTCMNLLLDINVAYNRHILVGLQCVFVCLIILAFQCVRPIHVLLIYIYVSLLDATYVVHAFVKCQCQSSVKEIQ